MSTTMPLRNSSVTSSTTVSVSDNDSDLTPFHRRYIDLIEGQKYGHMSLDEYVNGNMREWHKFLQANLAMTDPDYYPIKEEPELIEQAAPDSIKYILEKGVKVATGVSWGCGTAWELKEWPLIKKALEEGVKFPKFILIEGSSIALDKTVAQIKEKMGEVEFELECYQADMFDPATRNLFTRAEGSTVLGMLFGLTAENVEGNYRAASPPLSLVKKKYEGIFGQLKEGDQFFTVNDHNDDEESLTNMFRLRTQMARNILKHHMKWGRDTLEQIDLTVAFSKKSRILAQQWHHLESKSFYLDGERDIDAGTKLSFNNSVKLLQDDSVYVKEDVGFDYPLDPKVIMHPKGRLGWHHTEVGLG